ncbi:MAG: NAD(P)/FAD-dependent oxidoreductase [Acetobacterium sp.]
MKTLVLVGGGHAHVYIINQLARNKLNDVKVILISASKKQYYSGMASAYIEGIYSEDEFSFNLPVMCEKSDIQFVEDKVIGIDPQNKILETLTGQRIAFDLLSMDTGSELAGKSIKGSQDFAQMVKPLTNLIRIKEMLLSATNPQMKIVITGAGAAGVEMALSIRALSTKKNHAFDISIIEAGSEIMNGYENGIKKACEKRLSDWKVKLILNERVNEITATELLLQSGKSVPYELIIWAAGAAASPMYREAGFQVDKGGYMLVQPTLQALDYPTIFGAGDCIAFKDYDYVKKVGVYAIRESPVLWTNLKNSIEGKDLVRYEPQKTYLSIVNQGNRHGVLSYKHKVLKGKLVWRLKDYIDSGFMESHQ